MISTSPFDGGSRGLNPCRVTFLNPDTLSCVRVLLFKQIINNMKIFKKWWWDSTGKYLPHIILDGIKNLFKWFKIVWNDRDFDHSYISYVLKFKLENTANYIEKHQRYERYELDVQRIRLAINLLDKIIEDYYQMEYQNFYEVKFNWEGLDKKSFELKDKVIKNNLQDYFLKYPNGYRKIEKHEDNDVIEALTLGKFRHDKAKRLFFELLNRHLEEWWD